MVESAQLCVGLEDAVRAAELIPLLGPVAGLHGMFCIPVNYGGPIAGALAGLLQLCGDREGALPHARRAVESTAALGARPAEMSERRALACLLRTLGNPESADTEESSARRIADELGLVDAYAPPP